jgi:hypothetical protein
MAFDTLSYARRLKQAGMPEAQAEAIADATRDFVLQDVATNAGLAAVERNLRAEISRVEQALRAEIGRVEQALKAEIASLRGDMVALERRSMAALEAQALRLTVRMGIMLAAGLSLSTALIGLLIRLH